MIELQAGKAIDIKYLPGRRKDFPISVLSNELVKRELFLTPKADLEDGIRYMIDHWDNGTMSYKY